MSVETSSNDQLIAHDSIGEIPGNFCRVRDFGSRSTSSGTQWEKLRDSGVIDPADTLTCFPSPFHNQGIVKRWRRASIVTGVGLVAIVLIWLSTRA